MSVLFRVKRKSNFANFAYAGRSGLEGVTSGYGGFFYSPKSTKASTATTQATAKSHKQKRTPVYTKENINKSYDSSLYTGVLFCLCDLAVA